MSESEVTSLSAEAIQEIERLTRRQDADTAFVRIPESMVPDGCRFAEPVVLRTVSADGSVGYASAVSLLRDLAGKPERRTGTAKVTTLKSFIDLVNRHKSADTAIFVDADWRKPVFTAVVDYHQCSAGIAPSETATLASAALGDDLFARYGKHRIAYAFPLSEPWKIWISKNAVPMAQPDFASFLEDHIHEVASPLDTERTAYEAQFKTRIATPNELMDLARGLEVNVEAKIVNKSRLQTGETQVVFETSHKDASGGELIVPGLFMLAVPPFHKGEEIRIPARLRYRASGGTLVWLYELFRPDLYIDERIADDVAEVERETGLPAYHGEPEA